MIVAGLRKGYLKDVDYEMRFLSVNSKVAVWLQESLSLS